VGARLSTIVPAKEETPAVLRLIRHGPVALAASQAAAASASPGAVARVLGAAAEQVIDRARLDELRGHAGPVRGTEGLAWSVVALAAPGRSRATLAELRATTEALAANWIAARLEQRAQPRVETLMIGSAVLAAIVDCLGVGEIWIEPAEPPPPRHA
jgi:hypothetical protein